MDVNGDGKITREDMQAYLSPLFGYTVEGRELDEQYQQVDRFGKVRFPPWGLVC